LSDTNRAKDFQIEIGENTYVDNKGSWSLLNLPATRTVLINTYFAFTTLTSVGFGDFYPVSKIERGCYVLVFLFGVALFSYFMGDL